jgi:FkbM family methyltransferase
VNANLIFDIGLHVGQDTDYYLKKGFKVVAVEANPKLAKECTERFKAEIARGDLTILNIGIAKTEGILPFYVNEHVSEWSSFHEEVGTSRGPFTVIEVPTVTLESLVRERGTPYYIKLDIEGLDHTAVVSLRGIEDKPSYISIENGQAHMIAELAEQGYTRFKFVNQKNIHETRLSAPAKEGKYIDYQFPFGSSGPFGDELPGEWVSRALVTQQSSQYWGNPNLDGNIHGWFDLHAAR